LQRIAKKVVSLRGDIS